MIIGFGLDLNLTINSDMDTIVRAMAEPDSGLDIRDRIWLKMPIPKSFLGMTRKRNPFQKKQTNFFKVLIWLIGYLTMSMDLLIEMMHENMHHLC